LMGTTVVAQKLFSPFMYQIPSPCSDVQP